MRPHWDDVWLGCAQVIARRSLCSRAQVGCVIVDDRYRVVSSGYNGPPRGFDHRDEPCTMWCVRGQADNDPVAADYSDCPSLHAEANALMAADRSAWQGGVLYVTGHVCSGCAKLIGNSGLSRIVVQEDGADRSYRGPDDSYTFIRSLGIGVEVLPVPTDPNTLPNVYLGNRSIIMSSTAGWINVHPGHSPEFFMGVVEDFLDQPLQDGIRTVRDQNQ